MFIKHPKPRLFSLLDLFPSSPDVAPRVVDIGEGGVHLEPVLAEHLAALRALHPEIRLDEPGYDDAAIIIRASNERSAKFYFHTH